MIAVTGTVRDSFTGEEVVGESPGSAVTVQICNVVMARPGPGLGNLSTPQLRPPPDTALITSFVQQISSHEKASLLSSACPTYCDVGLENGFIGQC